MSAGLEKKSLCDVAGMLKPQRIVPIVWCIVLCFVCLPVCMLMFITPSAMSARCFNAALKSLQEGDATTAATRLKLSLRLNPDNDAARDLFTTLIGELPPDHELLVGFDVGALSQQS